MDRYILDFDYLAQLKAIRGLLSRNRQTAAMLSEEIFDSEQWARQTTGRANDFAVGQTIDLIYMSSYQEMAHSMAALGMLAPFMEGVFKDVFGRIDERMPPRSGKLEKIRKVVEERGLTPYYLPDGLFPTIEALFRYRNIVLHWGFEWPEHVCQQFQRATGQWPDGWFDEVLHDEEPQMFSMSATFINYCFEVAKETAGGLQDYLIDVGRQENGLPPLGSQKEQRPWLEDV